MRINEPSPDDQSKPFGDQPPVIPATTPGELMLEYRYIQAEIYKYSPITSNPDLDKWIQQLTKDAKTVALKYPDSGRQDLLMALIGTFSQAATNFENNPSGPTQDMFNKTFSNLQNEINNWVNVQDTPAPYPEVLPKMRQQQSMAKTKAFGEQPI